MSEQNYNELVKKTVKKFLKKHPDMFKKYEKTIYLLDCR